MFDVGCTSVLDLWNMHMEGYYGTFLPASATVGQAQIRRDSN